MEEFLNISSHLLETDAKIVKGSTHNSCKDRRHTPNHIDTAVRNAQNLVAIRVGIGCLALRYFGCFIDSKHKITDRPPFSNGVCLGDPRGFLKSDQQTHISYCCILSSEHR
jgi:hypothetical protein